MPTMVFVAAGEPEAAHLVIGLGHAATLCGLTILRWQGGDMGMNEDRWPTPPAPWCRKCLTRYSG